LNLFSKRKWHIPLTIKHYSFILSFSWNERHSKTFCHSDFCSHFEISVCSRQILVNFVCRNFNVILNSLFHAVFKTKVMQYTVHSNQLFTFIPSLKSKIFKIVGARIHITKRLTRKFLKESNITVVRLRIVLRYWYLLMQNWYLKICDCILFSTIAER
jgi:hypothetical protein